MKYSFIFLFSLLFSFAQAQETSDPKTKGILDGMKAKFESFSSISSDFTLTIGYPEEDPIIQKGQLKMAGEKYNINLGEQAIISDGTSLWLYLKNRNEVQINDMEDAAESGELMSPKDLLSIYEQEDYIYALTFEGKKAGKTIQEIEFKPTNAESEYSKLRITIDQTKKELMSIKTFSKDGSRVTLELANFTPNKRLDNSLFAFDKAKYPGVKVEDLRL